MTSVELLTINMALKYIIPNSKLRMTVVLSDCRGALSRSCIANADSPVNEAADALAAYAHNPDFSDDTSCKFDDAGLLIRHHIQRSNLNERNAKASYPTQCLSVL